ncbi:MAG: hypothetical protein ACE5IJ_10095 [Thermoplasmata archaeon]
MGIEDMLDVLRRVNGERKEPVDEDLLEQIIALVLKNPLEEDRGRCQEQVATIIHDRVRR